MKIPWKKLNVGDLVVIRWVDIVATESWISKEEAKNMQPLECMTVGWLISCDSDVVRLVSTVGENSNTNVVAMPKGVIQAVDRVDYEC
jgi:hypothetical protein